jgi:hypothetical protein
MTENASKEAIIDFCNAIEAACVNLKHNLGAKPSEIKYPWDPEKIGWTDKKGQKGPFQISEDVNNMDFKAMLQDLGGHGGKLNREGVFYWTFKNGTTVGRKKVGKT